ncbi:TIGR04222 domain-containing membrane protein, partial [Streptomyces zhihengii]
MTELALLVWSAVVVSSVLLLVRVSAARRGAPRHLAPRLGAWEAAFLAGGPARVADAALAALHADGRIRVGAPGVVAAGGPAPHDQNGRAAGGERLVGEECRSRGGAA